MMDNECFDDFECGVMPVQDFHSMASHALVWCDRWESCVKSWREVADDWRNKAQRANRAAWLWWGFACISPTIAVLFALLLHALTGSQ